MGEWLDCKFDGGNLLEFTATWGMLLERTRNLYGDKAMPMEFSILFRALPSHLHIWETTMTSLRKGKDEGKDTTWALRLLDHFYRDRLSRYKVDGQEAHVQEGWSMAMTTRGGFSGCFNCGQDGHIANDCPQGEVKTCFNCHEQGHVSKDCKQQAKKGNGAAPPKQIEGRSESKQKPGTREEKVVQGRKRFEALLESTQANKKVERKTNFANVLFTNVATEVRGSKVRAMAAELNAMPNPAGRKMIVDSATTSASITWDAGSLTDVVPSSDVAPYLTGTGEVIHVTATGTYRGSMTSPDGKVVAFVLPGVRVAPAMAATFRSHGVDLLASTQHLAEHGWVFCTGPNRTGRIMSVDGKVAVPTSEHIMGYAVTVGDHKTTTVTFTRKLAHKTFLHLGQAATGLLEEGGQGITLIGPPTSDCRVCPLAHLATAPRSHGKHAGVEPGGEIHLDYMGPFNAGRFDKVKYALVAVDAATLLTVVVLRSSTGDGGGALRKIKTAFRLTKPEHTTLVMDRAASFTGGSGAKFITDEGFQVRFMAPGEHNGNKAERRIGVAKADMRSLMVQAGITEGSPDSDLWPEALRESVAIRNRLRRQVDEGMSPIPLQEYFELAEPPTLADRRPWGCRVMALKPGRRPSLGPVADEGVYLGVDADSSFGTYKFTKLSTDSRRISRSRSVQFFTADFPLGDGKGQGQVMPRVEEQQEEVTVDGDEQSGKELVTVTEQSSGLAKYRAADMGSHYFDTKVPTPDAESAVALVDPEARGLPIQDGEMDFLGVDSPLGYDKRVDAQVEAHGRGLLHHAQRQLEDRHEGGLDEEGVGMGVALLNEEGASLGVARLNDRQRDAEEGQSEAVALRRSGRETRPVDRLAPGHESRLGGHRSYTTTQARLMDEPDDNDGQGDDVSMEFVMLTITELDEEDGKLAGLLAHAPDEATYVVFDDEHGYDVVPITEIPEPRTKKEFMAMTPVWQARWEVSRDSEMRQLMLTGVITVVPRHLVAHLPIVRMKWIHKVKVPSGRLKSRSVALGFLDNVDSAVDTYAPTVYMETLRVALVVGVSQPNFKFKVFDITGAFCSVTMTRMVRLAPPWGFELPEDLGAFADAGSYGLTTTPSDFYREVDVHFRRAVSEGGLGFKRSKLDKCMYIAHDDEEQVKLLMVIHVDDLLVQGTEESLQWFQDQLSTIYTITESTDGEYLGLGITRDKGTGGVILSQARQIKELAVEYKQEAFLPGGGRQVATPSASGEKLSLLTDKVQHNGYRTLVGKLGFIVKTRADIACVVRKLGEHNQANNEEHFAAAVRVVQYLACTVNVGFRICPVPRDRMELVAFADSTFAEDAPTKGQSSGGRVLFVGSNAVLFKSHRQKRTALSSCSAEFCEQLEAALDVVHVSGLLEELGYPQRAPTRQFCDAAAVIGMMGHAVPASKTTRHLAVRFHKLKEMIQDSIIVMTKIGTADNIADCLTKALPAAQHRRLFSFIQQMDM